MTFRPIAIVGQSCVLPGALSPAALWEAVAQGKDLLSAAPAGRWRLPADRVLCDPARPDPDRAWSDRGGYVQGFEQVWDPSGFAMPAEDLAGLDPLFHWTLHCAREARRQARGTASRVGAIIGNLGFPSEGMAEYAHSVWSGRDDADPRNRFMSGGLAATLARALELDAGAYCLDAACASSLYAIKLACDRLARGDADLMLAGAVQRADDLFLHVGFCALGALSKSGRSRPFHRDADGLVPAEGAAMVALKRLDDARRDGDAILAVIRGIGLSNDGRGKGLLAPAEEGQRRAMQLAYAAAGIDPVQVSLLECHATGTPVGDATELASSATVFAGCRELPVGSLKSNLGHLITSAGASAVIKVIEAMRHRQRPPTLHVDAPTAALDGTPFRPLTVLEDWPSDRPRIAGISAFGFGGNNAHLVLAEDDPSAEAGTPRPGRSVRRPETGNREPEAGEPVAGGALRLPATSYRLPSRERALGPIAIVGLGCRIAAHADRGAFTEALFAGGALGDPDGEGRMHEVVLDLDGLRFPPKDLERSLPQQLAVLAAAREALAEIAPPPRERTGVFVGMEPDAEVARYGSRWRLALPAASDSALAQVRDGVVPALDAAAVVGCMPNIPANRLSAQFDLGGPAFTVQAGADSGVLALRLAAEALGAGELDVALAGAVDLGCEPVQRAALGQPPADAAVLWALKRLEDAERDGDRIYAVLDHEVGKVATKLDLTPRLDLYAVLEHVGEAGTTKLDLTPRLGHAGAARAMVDATAAALALHHRRHPDGTPWLADQSRAIGIAAEGTSALRLREAASHPRRSEHSLPRLHVFGGVDREAVLEALRSGRERREGPARCVLVATDADLASVRERAIAHLENGAPPGSGVHFRAAPIEGDLAFAFAGAGAAYPGMGRELVLHLPQLGARLATRSRRLAIALDGWLDANAPPPHDVEHQLWAASALSQLHLELTRGLLGLRPQAWLGYSSGETNALFAAGVWRDADALIEATERSGMMRREIGGSFDAVARAWGVDAVRWQSWTVAAPLAEIRAALEAEARVHLAIVSSEDDALIAGDADGCARVVERIGAARCLPLDYALAVHVPELAEVAAAWRELHTLPTASIFGARLYSSAQGRAYAPSPEACAAAIHDQAVATLDLRPAIRAAWDDGVRVFVEHGPGGGYARAIRAALGEREALVVSLDRRGQGVEATLNAIAALVAAGLPVDLDALAAAMPQVAEKPAATRVLRVPAHPPPVRLPAVRTAEGSAAPLDLETLQPMPPAPALPPVDDGAAFASSNVVTLPAAITPPLDLPQPLAAAVAHLGQLADLQQRFAQRQAELHGRFLALRQAESNLLLRLVPAAANAHAPAPALAMPWVEAPRPPEPQAAPSFIPSARPSPVAVVPAKAGTQRSRDVVSETWIPASAGMTDETSPVADATPKPRFTRAQLETHAGGRIADLFGEAFAFQEPFERQVRMPQPPLLLADRVIALEGDPLSMGNGRIVTETDVGADAWYAHRGRMPAGVLIEAGQADLMLISWLGVDRLNRGERVYRLLGCELTYHGDLPTHGDTLRFDIRLDGHAAQGDVRLMFFHYDCVNGGRRQLSVREGQAGFFTDDELAASAGCLWTPEEQTIVASPRLDPPAVVCTRDRFEADALDAFAGGDAHACFGPGFERGLTHTRTPAIAGGRMRLFDRVAQVSARGGPWGRGYLRAELDVREDHWFFDGHFKNDPCMPGTLMFEACLEAMAFHLAWQGFTLERDGWRFQPVPELPFKLQCRGQVLPGSKRLVTEVFVEEVVAGPVPTLYADLLCTVDGLKAFHARRVALQLVPDWPLDDDPALLAEAAADTRPVAEVEGFRFDRRSVLATALGRPSQAFGPRFARFDGPTSMPRLPGPPYLFISRIAAVEGALAVMRPGARVVAEYDLPREAWYFDHNGCARMPFAVLLEAALQPCGWLASYVGSALTTGEELRFRNLDGDGELLMELVPAAGTLRTEVELTDVSATAGMIVQSFTVQCTLDGHPVYRLRTVFGFFPPAALAAQVGLPTDERQRELLTRAGQGVELASLEGPDRARLPHGMLRVIERLDGVWPQAGAAGLGQLRSVKRVDPSEWFFKAHFFSDPVQPGSLGLEAMAQGLQAWAVHAGLDRDLRAPRLQSLALGRRHRWKYRGQVLPEHAQVHTTLEITEVGKDAQGRFAIADGSLWVDGRRIYEAQGLGVRVVEGDGRE